MYWIIIIQLYIHAALSNSSSSDDKSDDFEESMNLWPTEELFQSSEETIKSEVINHTRINDRGYC